MQITVVLLLAAWLTLAVIDAAQAAPVSGAIPAIGSFLPRRSPLSPTPPFPICTAL